MLKHSIVLPQQETVTPIGLVIMPNEIGAGLEDFHGARAQHVANTLGSAVLAYERPFSASSRTFNLGLRRHVTANAVSLADDTASELSGLVDNLGMGAVFATGHSAGAAEAIAITATEKLPIAKGFFTDPPAVRKSAPVKAEVFEYAWYTVHTERKKPVTEQDDTSGNIAPEQPPTAKQMLGRVAGEIATYSAFWRSTSSAQALESIALNQLDTEVSVVFPEHTFTASPAFLRNLQGHLNSLRPAGAPFRVDVVPGAYHSRFNNYQHFAEAASQHLALSA